MPLTTAIALCYWLNVFSIQYTFNPYVPHVQHVSHIYRFNFLNSEHCQLAFYRNDSLKTALRHDETFDTMAERLGIEFREATYIARITY